MIDALTRTLWHVRAAARDGVPHHELMRAARDAAKEIDMPDHITAPVRFIDGAGSHVRKFTPSKRIKAEHHVYLGSGGSLSLRSFARAVAKKPPAAESFAGAGDLRRAAIDWIKNKGR